jgi:hypothetical protein
MASDVKSGKGYTAPKGRPTVHPTGEDTSRWMSSTMEWVLAGIVFIAILGAIFYFGRDFNSGGGGGGHSGLPVEAPIVQLDEAPVG